MKIHEFAVNMEDFLIKKFHYYGRYKLIDNSDQYLKLIFFSEHERVRKSFQDLTGIDLLKSDRSNSHVQ